MRRRLALVTPLPPTRSGIADYARDLLPFVAADFEVEAFVDELHPLLAEGRLGPVPVHAASELRRRFADFQYVVYQIGNNLHHRYALELATQFPGVVVLHDLVLHHLYEDVAGREDAWDAYGDALEESYGSVGLGVLRWKRWKLASERENFALPLFEPLAVRSRGLLVHNHAAEAEVVRRLPGVPVARIPMGVPLEPEIDLTAARRRLGLSPEHVVVGSFGLITSLKRLEIVAAALRKAWMTCPGLRLVLVGETSNEARLERLFDPAGLASGRVRHVGYVSAEEYRQWMAATDVAVNLRYPTAGETSASLLRLLGEGKCTLVSAYRQFLEIPADAVVRIPLGEEEESTLVRELVALAGDPARRRRIGDAARSFVAREHSMEAAAREFRSALEAIAAAPGPRRSPLPLWCCPKTSRSAAIAGSARLETGGEIRLRAGTVAEVALVLRNEGESRWIAMPEPSGGHVGFGADVVDPSGTVSRRIRAVPLRSDVEPGAELRVCLRVEAPLPAGEYRLQPALVHFGRGGRMASGAAIPLVAASSG